MPKPLVFMMGRSPAFLPTDRDYTTNHLWIRSRGEASQLGFSAYAVRLLGDIHHLAWTVATGSSIRTGQNIGFIEGSKATSDLYAPIDATVVAINRAVLADASLVNSELYEEGWLLEVCGTPAGTLTPEQYLAHLEACWPLAQRLLKGQASRQARSGGSAQNEAPQ